MALAMPVVWSDRHRLHDPGGEVWVGVRTPAPRCPRGPSASAPTLAAGGRALRRRRAATTTTRCSPSTTPRCVEYLAGAWARVGGGRAHRDPGQDRVVPYVFAHPGLTRTRPADPGGGRRRAPGYFAYDTMTLIGPGTWEAARAAVDVGADRRRPRARRRARRLRVLPPAGPPRDARDASAAPATSTTRPSPPRACARALDRPVAVIDIDAHHGNGTQAIFYDDPDVLVGSVHVDPGAGWFPHFLGFAGRDRARGANRNLPLAPGAGDDEWVAAVRELARLGAAAAQRARRRARRRRRRRRPGEPARGHGGGLPRRGPRARRAGPADRRRPGGRLRPRRRSERWCASSWPAWRRALDG